MIEFALGAVAGIALGYATRSWLSARRRRLARISRIASGSDRAFVPYKPEMNAEVSGEQSTSTTSLQPHAENEDEIVEFRGHVKAKSRT